MTVANAMILVDQTAVPLALPSIMKQFGVSTNVAEWVLNASLLALSGLLILGGKLGDVLGRRRIFPLGTVLFTAGSALGGLALMPTTLPMVVLSRVAGNWYDKAGGRPPLVVGFAVLATSGLAL